MPSSFGLWFAAYAECLAEDLQAMLAAYRVADLNPLGSGAGYGSSFPIDRRLTTDLLGFEDMHYNVVNAQMSRGRTERLTSFGLSSLAGTLSRLAGDVCLFASQNFGLLQLPDEFTTGSSIMPHKKNPDVFELIRAKCNKIQALPGEIEHIYINLPSGYFRDMQIIKESFLPVFAEMKSCLSIAAYALEKVIPWKIPCRMSGISIFFRWKKSTGWLCRALLSGKPTKRLQHRLPMAPTQSDQRLSTRMKDQLEIYAMTGLP